MLIAILIKLEDPKGSVFFYQTRIGKGEKPFRMYKFRSMVSNAEEKLKELLSQNEIQGAMFKMKDDPRITRVGKIHPENEHRRAAAADQRADRRHVAGRSETAACPGKWRSIRSTTSFG